MQVGAQWARKQASEQDGRIGMTRWESYSTEELIDEFRRGTGQG